MGARGRSGRSESLVAEKAHGSTWEERQKREPGRRESTWEHVGGAAEARAWSQRKHTGARGRSGESESLVAEKAHGSTWEERRKREPGRRESRREHVGGAAKATAWSQRKHTPC